MNLDEARAALSRGMCSSHKLATDGCATCRTTLDALAAFDDEIEALRAKAMELAHRAGGAEKAVAWASQRMAEMQRQIDAAREVVDAARPIVPCVDGQGDLPGDLWRAAAILAGRLALYDRDRRA